MPVDPKHIDVPNICFSLTKENDEREEAFSKQRVERGFDDSETWSLDYTLARFLLPRLKRYLELSRKVIYRPKEEEQKLDDLVKMLELIIKDGDGDNLSIEEKIHIGKSLPYLSELLFSLWW